MGSGGGSDRETPLDVFKRATTATVRAISGEGPELGVQFARGSAGVTRDGVRLPPPSPLLTPQEVATIRGAGDAAALRLAHHDTKIHGRIRPDGDLAGQIFDAMEQARAECSGSEHMPGLRHNLRQHLGKRFSDAKIDKVKHRRDAPLSEVMRALVGEAVLGEPVPEATRAAVDLWRPVIEDKLGQRMGLLKQNFHDQQAFGLEVRDLLRDLDVDLGTDIDMDDENESEDDSPPEEEPTPGEDGDADAQNRGDASDMPPDGPSAMMESEAELGEGDSDGDGELEESEDIPSGGEEAAGPWDDEMPWQPPRRNDLPETDYVAYTTAFDEVVDAEDLADEHELDRLREMLDRDLSNHAAMVSRLANKLQRKLLAQQRRAWQFDLEEGILDAARLSRIVTNPGQPLSYKQELDTEFRDTVVCLLIDNSGSMRGRPIATAAQCTDILARTLERCGVKTEILGFTTRRWKGGLSREKWLQEGKPRLPGRLTDIRHIIYKSADSPWRRSRRNLGLMLKEGILKDNIDGEALLWAYQRLLARPEQRRIIMVISDGAPLDDTTLSVNASSYLETHLNDVVEFIEKRGVVELLAVGIGHDVSRHYSRTVRIMDVADLGSTMTRELSDLFEEKGR
ncbi:MAG: cobaltochelatase subunit CobT [Alphaproteobacteria bacterium]